MATIAEQLTELQAVKSGLKTAITSDGADMSAVPFTDYPGKVQAMSERWRSLLDGSITEMDFTGFTEIRAGICSDCFSLIRITIPDTCIRIRSRAFWGCRNLGDTVIPDSVSTIDSIAFSGCKAMEKLVIGSGCSRIELQALRIGSPSNPATIIMRATTPPQIDSTTIGEYVSRIIVPVGTGDTYKAASVWSNYASIIEEGTA